MAFRTDPYARADALERELAQEHSRAARAARQVENLSLQKRQAERHIEELELALRSARRGRAVAVVAAVLALTAASLAGRL